MSGSLLTIPGADQWQQWAKTRVLGKREREDLLTCEVDQHALGHMELPRSRSSLEDNDDEDDEREDICRQMKILRAAPECLPIPSGFLAPPMLRRAKPTGSTIPRQSGQTNTDASSLDASIIHSVKSTSSVPPPQKDIEPTRSRAALSA